LNKTLLLLPPLACIALLQSTAALALDGRQEIARPGQAVPFGGAYSSTRDGKRAGDIKRPGSTICALRGQTRGMTGSTTRQDASGKLHLFNDPARQKSRSGDIYDDCDGSLVTPPRAKAARKPASAYNARTNTLNAATDGYVNRSATSSMMPRRPPSMYDPATGVLKGAKRPNAYRIYQE